MTLRAAIWDFNGVVVDDEPLHFAASRRALAEAGVALGEAAYFGACLGFDDRRLMSTVAPDGADIEALVERKAAVYFELLERGFDLVPGAAALVESMAAVMPLAICSGARRREIETILGQVGLRDCFTALVSADEILHGKPDPSGYLAAYDLLRRTDESIEPGDCLAIEDAPAGVRAARRAGLRCLAVSRSTDAARLAEADRVVATLADLELVDLGEWFATL